jgi:hypothetical protein
LERPDIGVGMATEDVFDFFLAPFKAVALVLSLPVRGFTWVAVRLKKPYDPERTVCPGCGFRGDDGTGGKSCTVIFIRTRGIEKAALQCRCLRCGCPDFYVKLFLPADKWLR